MAAMIVQCGRGKLPGRFAALQLASVLGVLILIEMTFAFEQPSSIDVALTLGLLSLPASLLLAVFVERWL
ncbi:MAG: monovalent cation/H+ antiporter complex subunit F [Rhizomicrobium sp.]